jgi:cysteine-S-conjugate beta-lyase
MNSGPRKPGSDKRKLSTRIAHAGRDRKLTLGGVNPVVQRASTVLVESADKLFAPGNWTYGRHGSATHEALKQAMMELEDAQHCALVASGLMACTVPFLAFASSGAHVLVGDNTYGPTRRFCDRTLKPLDVETEYFDTTCGADIEKLIRPNTRMIFLESPGSMTFEVADLKAIAAVAKAKNVVTVLDNTWSGGVFLKPLALGMDVSVQANTKYVSGGADVINGAILTNHEKLISRVKEVVADIGSYVSADDAFTTLRGLRTLAVRMEKHQASAMEVALFLKKHMGVQRVLHPALPDDPGHELWERDFTGSSGLFGLVLKQVPTRQVHAFLDSLELFGLGFSYGGFESLAIHCDPQLKRTTTVPNYGGPLIRISIGLEEPADLIADLAQALEKAGL